MGWQNDPVVSQASVPRQPWMDDPVHDVMQSTDWSGIREGLRSAGKFAAPAVFPAIGAVLGSPLGPGGQIVGGLGGVAVNQILGITEPSVIEPAAQAIVPGGAKTLGAGKRLLPAFGTEARGAETLHRLATPEIRNTLTKLYPKVPSSQLFKQVEEEGARMVGIQTAEQAAKQELEKISKALPTAQSDYGKLKGYAEDITGKEGQMEIGEFQQALHDVGKKTKVEDAMTAGGYKQIYKGLMEDLEQAPKLADARQAFKREMVIKEIKNTTKPFTVAGGGDAEKFRANKLMNRLNDPEDPIAKSFKSSFTPQEQKLVMDKLTLLNKLPPIQPPSGAHHGFGKVSKTAGALLAGGGAAVYGYPVIGAAIAGVPYTARLARDFSTAWKMEEGRALIKDLLKQSGGKFTPQVWAGIQAFAASPFAQPKYDPTKDVSNITISPR